MDAKQLIAKIAKKNELSRRLVEKGAPMVGIFWIDPAKKKIELALAEPTKSIKLEPGSEFITGPHAHFAVWEQLKRNGLLPNKWKDLEYEYVPRGRVLYDRRKRRYKVFSSQSLAESQWCREQVIREFNLLQGKTSFSGDEHYEKPLKSKGK